MIEELNDEVREVVAPPESATPEAEEQASFVAPVIEEITPEEATAGQGEVPAVPVAENNDAPLILAVDDSPTIRKLVSMTLEREGFQVITASDGLEAVQLLSEHMPDMILSDVNMPKLDGYKLCRFVKKSDRTKHIPFVMLSGKDGVFDKLRGKMFGCGDYITKPFEAADLVEKVRMHTGVYTS